jgi:ADP-dependent NAD(P)H-hydrate dehydratase
MDQLTEIPKLPPRPADGHKGMFGRVLIVGGSDSMLGAPSFAGQSALRTGSGLVQIAVPKSILQFCLSITPELIGMALQAGKTLQQAAEKADALVIGPGMGQSAAAKAALFQLVRLDKPMVIDADGLNMLAAQKRWPTFFKAHAVLTPHPGEMQRLGKLIGRKQVPTDEAGRIAIAAQAAQAFGQVVVLKGHRTVVTDGRRLYINHTGDSTLSKAGSGDILSGIIGCLLGQKVNPFDAAVLGTHLHGLAGEIAGKQRGRRCALAREIIDVIPQAVAKMEKA